MPIPTDEHPETLDLPENAESTDDAYERGYEAGKRQAALALLHQALKELDYQGDEAARAKWIMEREQVIALLRRACARYGSNTWSNNLHLADVLGKHLFRQIGLEA